MIHILLAIFVQKASIASLKSIISVGGIIRARLPRRSKSMKKLGQNPRLNACCSLTICAYVRMLPNQQPSDALTNDSPLLLLRFSS
jgi:hypothetical protein